MPDDVASGGVDPHGGDPGARWIGHENELVSRLEPMHDPRPVGEHRPVHGGPELIDMRLDRRHMSAGYAWHQVPAS
jgi:hypothetical protein